MLDARWPLLRIWHLEVMDCLITSPHACTFTRESYVTAPPFWITLPPAELARRIEQLLAAHYRIRAATLATPWNEDRMAPFAFDFEWVRREANPPHPNACAEPWLLPAAHANRHLAETAFREIDAALAVARPGLAARCYEQAFAFFRIDDNDTWHVVGWTDRAALFTARYG